MDAADHAAATYLHPGISVHSSIWLLTRSCLCRLLRPSANVEWLTDARQRVLYPTESRQFLLYARQIEIRGVDIDNPYYNYIISFTVPDIDNVTVVDYDALEHRIYWSDVRTQTIKRAFINGTGVETVVSAGKLLKQYTML